MTITKKAFLLEKLPNFRKFVDEKIPDVPKFKQTLVALSQATPEEFASFVITYIKPHRSNLDNYINSMCDEFQVEKGQFKDDDVKKFKRYLECFVDVLQNDN